MKKLDFSMKEEDFFNSLAGKAITVIINLFCDVGIVACILSLIVGVIVVIILSAYMELAELIIISSLMLLSAFLIFWVIFKEKIFGKRWFRK